MSLRDAHSPSPPLSLLVDGLARGARLRTTVPIGRIDLFQNLKLDGLARADTDEVVAHLMHTTRGPLLMVGTFHILPLGHRFSREEARRIVGCADTVLTEPMDEDHLLGDEAGKRRDAYNAYRYRYFQEMMMSPEKAQRVHDNIFPYSPDRCLLDREGKCYAAAGIDEDLSILPQLIEQIFDIDEPFFEGKEFHPIALEPILEEMCRVVSPYGDDVPSAPDELVMDCALRELVVRRGPVFTLEDDRTREEIDGSAKEYPEVARACAHQLEAGAFMPPAIAGVKELIRRLGKGFDCKENPPEPGVFGAILAAVEKSVEDDVLYDMTRNPAVKTLRCIADEIEAIPVSVLEALDHLGMIEGDKAWAERIEKHLSAGTTVAVVGSAHVMDFAYRLMQQGMARPDSLLYPIQRKDLADVLDALELHKDGLSAHVDPDYAWVLPQSDRRRGAATGGGAAGSAPEDF